MWDLFACRWRCPSWMAALSPLCLLGGTATLARATPCLTALMASAPGLSSGPSKPLCPCARLSFYPPLCLNMPFCPCSCARYPHCLPLLGPPSSCPWLPFGLDVCMLLFCASLFAFSPSFSGTVYPCPCFRALLLLPVIPSSLSPFVLQVSFAVIPVPHRLSYVPITLLPSAWVSYHILPCE